jgi:hypothetical protein
MNLVMRRTTPLMILFQVTIAISLLLMATYGIGRTLMPPASATVLDRPSLVESMKKTVVFLQTNCLEFDSNGNQVTKSYSGTAFLLGLADSRLNGGLFTYLVTNRHMAQPGIEKGSSCQQPTYDLRVDTRVPNRAGSYSMVEEVPLAWTFPADPSVDLAIAPIGIDQNKLDVMFLPSTLLMSNADVARNKVEEGDSVLFTGLFVQMKGQTHSEPIVREGKIAMMPKEQIPTTLPANGDIYLVDCHVFGGNSGSPMFVNLAGQRESGLIAGLNYKLLGVVSGYVRESENFELQTVASYAGTVDANSGIATVVPAQKILDLLNAPTLKGLRENAISSLAKKRLH